MHENIISLLTLRIIAQQMRRGAQVLGSSGKQIAHLLPTLLMTINQIRRESERKKKIYALESKIEIPTCRKVLNNGNTFSP